MVRSGPIHRRALHADVDACCTPPVSHTRREATCMSCLASHVPHLPPRLSVPTTWPPKSTTPTQIREIPLLPRSLPRRPKRTKCSLTQRSAKCTTRMGTPGFSRGARAAAAVLVEAALGPSRRAVRMWKSCLSNLSGSLAAGSFEAVARRAAGEGATCRCRSSSTYSRLRRGASARSRGGLRLTGSVRLKRIFLLGLIRA
mmetsp:Transcript_31622/g.73619  ORF Transcript_31622/g.73619 Transcript_31622/m.73619 type:complete len:200 (-) Transcript_31622:911-1510(-)